MTRTRIVGGKIIETTGGDYNIYTEENIVYSAATTITETGVETGVSYGNKPKVYVPKKNILTTKVKEIECVTALDNGSKNDGSGQLQGGFIYGKTYKFKIKSFTNGDPKDKSAVKWMYKYHNLTDNKWVEVHSNNTGEEYAMHFNEKEMCGRFIYIYAYIEDEKLEGELKIWKHNRFRFFDKKIFQIGLAERRDNPKLINQHATSLCGTAAVLYFYSKDYKESFYNSFNDFFRTGEVKINTFNLKPNKNIYDFDPSLDNLNYPHYSEYSDGTPCVPHKLMHQSDWIVLAGTRSSDNNDYLGVKGQDWDAINWTSYMIDATTKLYGATSSIDRTRIITGLNFQNDLIQIQKDFQEGWHIIMLIDSDMLDDSYSIFGCITQYHWISYEGDLYIDEVNNKFNFSYYCWQKLNKNATIRKSVFNSNFYGYIKFKK